MVGVLGTEALVVFISGLSESLYQQENEKGPRNLKAIIRTSNLYENVQNGDKDIELKDKRPGGREGEVEINSSSYQKSLAY